MARLVFPDLSTFRKRLVYYYEQHRKVINDNLGLIIALAASAAAIWSGYEAHKARIEAGEIGRKTLEAQIRSVDEQAKATQLDERPYVKVDLVATGRDTNHDFDISPVTLELKLTAYGRTPAIDIDVADIRDFSGNPVTEGDFPTFTRHSSRYPQFPFLFSGDSTQRRFYAYRKTAKDGFVHFFGRVFYTDNAHNRHSTPFCWSITIGATQKQDSFATCSERLPPLT